MRITNKQRAHMRQLRAEGLTIIQVAALCGFHRSTVEFHTSEKSEQRMRVYWRLKKREKYAKLREINKGTATNDQS